MTVELILPATPDETCTRRQGARDTKCRCSRACVSLASSARRAREERTGRGRMGRYSADVVSRHIRALLASAPGATNADVARATGVSDRAIRYLLGQEEGVRRPSVYTKTAVSILSVRALPTTGMEAVTPTVARRMVEALAVQGWSRADTAARAGLKAGTLAPVKSRTLSPVACAAVARVFRSLRYEHGTNSLATAYAQRSGYVPWAAWTPDIAAENAHADAGDIRDQAWRAAITARLARQDWPLAG